MQSGHVAVNSTCAMIGKEKRPIHIHASYRLTVRGFVLVKAGIFKPPFFSSLLLLFSLSYLYSFFEWFLNVFSSSKQNNGEKSF